MQQFWMRMVTVQRERIYLSFTLSISFQPLQLFSHLCYSWSHPSQPQLHTLSIHYCPAVVPHTYICNSWLHSMHWLVACPSSSHLCHIWLHSRHWLLTCPSSSNSATVGYIPSIDYYPTLVPHWLIYLLFGYMPHIRYWPALVPHICATVGYIPIMNYWPALALYLCHSWLHPSQSHSQLHIPSIDYWPTLAPHISATVGYIAACSRSTSFCALTKNINSHRVHINQ